MSEAQDKLLQGEMNMTLNMAMMTSARDAVGKCLATLGGEYDNMLVLTADVDTSSRIQAFKEKYPDRCYNVGIAEQNLMSVSAGLAHEGFRPLAFAFAPFASMRCYEQVRTDICYSKLPVVIIGNGAGYSNGASGCTHCALEDSALMVACNNMTVLEPGDPFQIAKLLEAAMELNAPVYIRLGREATSSLYPEDTKYEIGKALIPREGDDGAFICTGIMVMLSAGRSPAAPGVTHRMDTVPAPAMTTVSVASNWTPPQDRLALMPASRICSAMVPVCIYISATQVTPEAIISARPSPAPAATARLSRRASAGKIYWLSQVCRSHPPP